MSPDPHWYTPFWRTAHLASIALGHTIVAAVLFWSGQFLKSIVGDELLFDQVPMRYVVDLMEVGTVGSYIVFGTRSFVRALRQEDEE